jgi:hypothetical protein
MVLADEIYSTKNIDINFLASKVNVYFKNEKSSFYWKIIYFHQIKLNE